MESDLVAIIHYKKHWCSFIGRPLVCACVVRVCDCVCVFMVNEWVSVFVHGRAVDILRMYRTRELGGGATCSCHVPTGAGRILSYKGVIRVKGLRFSIKYPVTSVTYSSSSREKTWWKRSHSPRMLNSIRSLSSAEMCHEAGKIKFFLLKTKTKESYFSFRWEGLLYQ